MSDMRACQKCGRNVQAGPGARVTKKGLVHNICPAKRRVAMKMGQRRPAKRAQGCRGWKRDNLATMLAAFVDPRSYISLSEPPHLILYGPDKQQIRTLIYERDCGHCRTCGAELRDATMEWSHMLNAHNSFKRCDCPEGGISSCHNCHMKHENWEPKLRSVPQLGYEPGFIEETNGKAI